MIIVHGTLVDDQTRCVHYDGPTDVIAIRFYCCASCYPCYQCHDECAGHPIVPWPAAEQHRPGILCGVCRTELSITRYRQVTSCPHCDATFNERCALHDPIYFE